MTVLAQLLAATLSIVSGLPQALNGAAQEHRVIAYVEVSSRWEDPKEFMCLDALWMHESRWDKDARGPTKDFGIPQAHAPVHALPAAFYTDAAVQIEWGLDYIAQRYGSPCQAWQAWRARATRLPDGRLHGGWY